MKHAIHGTLPLLTLLAVAGCTAAGPAEAPLKASAPHAGKADHTVSPGDCTNTCYWANDGECDDGRPGADWAVCDAGTDCGDCGPWAEAVCPATGVLCAPDCPADGRLPSGAPCRRGELDEATCECVPTDTTCSPTGVVCDPSCPASGEIGGVPCERGVWDDATCTCDPTDAACPPSGVVCDPACPASGVLPSGAPCQTGHFDSSSCTCVAVCDDSCPWAGDGECDDGRPGADYSLCGYGTDCADCGPTS